jgi:hypothetical protein
MDDQYERRPGMGLKGLLRLLLNFLTLVVLLGSVGVVVAFAMVFFNPYTGYNPYPPPTIPATLGSPTVTYTPPQYLPTEWTPTASFTPQPSETLTPTETSTPSPTLEPSPTQGAPFALQVGSPARIQNFANDLGCDYLGVFGQVFNMNNEAILDLKVHLAGELPGLGPIDLWAITGSAPDLGLGGYLFNLSDQPVASEGTLWIQLDDGSGNPLSAQVTLDTSESCDENLIMVNWRQVR